MQNDNIHPVLNGDYPDPTIVRVGRDYYLTYSCAALTPGLKILHSRDLVHWRTLCSAVENAGCIAAPELIYLQGLFYLYYPAEGTNYVVTAKAPQGPWSQPVDLKIGGIDPGHVTGPDGTRYLYMNGGVAFELSADGPLKPPYTAYFQGGLTWPHVKFGIMKSLQYCVEAKAVQLP